MKYDLLIKDGTVIDGSGQPRFEADIGIVGDKIAAIGSLGTSASEVLDARDQIVSPGFVDAHTHMDAQIFWDPIGTCSCFHGVTSVVMGNCGFTLAPANIEDIDLVLENLAEAEAIPADVLAAGVEFKWKTFPEFIGVLEDLPKGINYAGYVGHSALRTYAMRERAFTHQATSEDLEAMAGALRDGLEAGAIGFSTSRNPSHIRPGGEPVASRLADWEEVEALVGVMAEMGQGVFEISRGHPLPHDIATEFRTRLKDLAVESGRPITFGVFSDAKEPGAWKRLLDTVAETNAAGGRMIAQAHSNTMYQYHTLRTTLPFDQLEPWKALKTMSAGEREAILTDPERRQLLIDAANGMPTQPDYDRLMLFEDVQGSDTSVAEKARQSGCEPPEIILDHILSSAAERFFRTPIANVRSEEIEAVLQHPNSVVTFSDSGAHVNQIADFSLQTHFLSHWVRKRGTFSLEQAVKRITSDITRGWGFNDRGLLAIGKKADITIFDADNIAPLMPETANDLPLQAVRLRQGANGIHATMVNGQILIRNGEHLGGLPGRVLKPGVSA